MTLDPDTIGFGAIVWPVPVGEDAGSECVANHHGLMALLGADKIEDEAPPPEAFGWGDDGLSRASLPSSNSGVVDRAQLRGRLMHVLTHKPSYTRCDSCLRRGRKTLRTGTEAYLRPLKKLGYVIARLHGS